MTRRGSRSLRRLGIAASFAVALAAPVAAQDRARFARAREHGRRFERAVAAQRRVLQAWLRHADPRTLLLPDRIPGAKRGLKPGEASVYRPHNSGADLYPYLILTSELTDPELYHGRMLEMLRNEVRYTTVLGQIPAELELATGRLGPPSFFGAGEYAKDGLLAVTELLGRTPWFQRMVDMTADAMLHAPVASRFGPLPASDAELNGDYLQTLVRLRTMTGEPRFREWARRIADAYLEEVMPANHGLPSSRWDFATHAGDGRLRLRDHGNEIVVGLLLLFAVENDEGGAWAARHRPALAHMLDRILESANPDGLLHDEIDAATLAPAERRLSDNWGYVYGAVYTFFQATGEARYRDAVRHVLGNLPRYRNHDWEDGSFDGYADAIESALYLAAKEPLPEALDWIESETERMLAMQLPSGHIEHWYGEGNFNRTLMLYALYQSQGCRPDRWLPGLSLGAVREGDRLYLSLGAEGEATGWRGRVRLDFARHKRVLNFARDYVRLNQFPEWYAVDETTLYTVQRAAPSSTPAPAGETRLGSELIAGIPLAPGDWVVEPVGRPPYAAGTTAGPTTAR